MICGGDGDEVHPEGFIGQAPCFLNLLLEDFRWGIGSCKACEPAGVTNGGNKFRITHPCHCPADKRVLHAEELASPLEETIGKLGIHVFPQGFW